MKFIKYILALKNIFFKNLNIRSVLGFLISGFFLWLTFHNSGLKIADLSIGQTQGIYFILAEICFVLSVWIYSIRAKLFWINETTNYSDINAFESIVVGNFYNCILPGNLGEGMRALHFSRKNKIPLIQSLSTTVAEKWIDAQVMFIFCISLLCSAPFIGHYIQYVMLYTCIAIAGLSLLYTLMRQNRTIEKKLTCTLLVFKKPGKILYKIYWFTSRLITGLIKRKHLTPYLFLCAAIFLLNALQFLFVLKSAAVAQPVAGLYTACLVAISMMFIAVIPSAPSSIGVLHYGIYSTLILSSLQYNSTPDSAALQSYARMAIYVHLSFIIPEVILGALFVFKERKFMF